MSENFPAAKWLTIADIGRDTGISKDTLRVWERRYGFPDPVRNAQGERLYTPDQLERLRLIKRLLDRGGRPAKVVPISIEQLRESLTLEPVVAGHLGSAPSVVQDELGEILALARVATGDALRGAMRRLLLKVGVQRFVVDCLPILNKRIGELWASGVIGIPDEHLYTETVQNILRTALQSPGPDASRCGPRVLLTTFPEEQHGIGLLMAEALLVSEGASCLSLGSQTPLDDLVLATLGFQFDVVALSFSAAYPRRQAIDGLRRLRASLPERIAIWAGGEGVARQPRSLDGVDIVPGIADLLPLLAAWRVDHKA